MQEISAFRKNVQEMFARELGVQIFPGFMEGPNTFGPEWIGSLFLQRVQEDPARPAEQQIYLILRLYAPQSSQGLISPSDPYDPAPVEEMAEKVQAAIARNPTGLGAWFQRVTGIEIDPVTQGLQATVFAYSSNAALGFTA